MTTSEIAETYARVLFDLATVADSVDTTGEGINSVAETIRGHMDLREALIDAQVTAEKKRDVLRDIFGESASPEVLAIVTLAVDRGHTESLGQIASEFTAIAEKERGIVVADVTTAIALDDATRASIIKKLSAALDRPVTLRERVDESIVGGIVIEVAGRVLDGSMSSQLDTMRSVLSSSPQGGEG